MSLPQMVVGSPETIAARLAEYQAAGVDGVQIMNILMPGSYDEFFEHVVPVLQAEGPDAEGVSPGDVAAEAVRHRYSGHLAAPPGLRLPRHVRRR